MIFKMKNIFCSLIKRNAQLATLNQAGLLIIFCK